MFYKNKNVKFPVIEVKKKDLPFSCPIKQSWDGHPKIYLNIVDKKVIKCPYCGIKYRLME